MCFGVVEETIEPWKHLENHRVGKKNFIESFRTANKDTSADEIRKSNGQDIIVVEGKHWVAIVAFFGNVFASRSTTLRRHVVE